MEKNNIDIIRKSIKESTIEEATDEKLCQDELRLINKFTRRKFKEDEVYVFSVILCDNDIDRQNERFSDESLEKLAKLFVGKTGIMDHDVKSENQKARIFSCKVKTEKNKKNQVGDIYKSLVARAYMPKTEKNQEFIIGIDSGIKKEVSISCLVEKIKCSICGIDTKVSCCSHVKGKVYKEKNTESLCHGILENPIDAYEWSFVAIPAQKKAGVIKAFNLESKEVKLNMQEIVKKLSLGEDINLNSKESLKLSEFIESLKEKAEIGREYFEELKSEVIRLSKVAQPEIEARVMESVVEKMSLSELKSFKEAYKKKFTNQSSVKPQLSRNIVKNQINTQFKI